MNVESDVYLRCFTFKHYAKDACFLLEHWERSTGTVKQPLDSELAEPVGDQTHQTTPISPTGKHKHPDNAPHSGTLFMS